MWPGLIKSRGVVVKSLNALIVRARSVALTPVVIPGA
ncbi:unannotated protein [freshwater metagenome]|uniref:Unannotated protein n=1 Tax=freshwater metagenome TaxID=449393 RepID=A0A6J6LG62_9ZZZZ